MRSFSLALLLFVSACGQEGTTPDTPSEPASTAAPSCPSDSTLTYASFGSTFLSNHCLACHADAEKPTLTTQAAVKANAQDIIAQAVKSTKMPQGGGVTTAEREQLGEWLSCGAP